MEVMSLKLALFSTVAWMLMLAISAILMIRKSRGISIEDLRIS